MNDYLEDEFISRMPKKIQQVTNKPPDKICERIETGALQIDDDWTGLFIRAPDAFTLRTILRDVLEYGDLSTMHTEMLCERLLVEIEQNVNHRSKDRNVQRIKTK